jgi:tRNA modification GTPase
MSDTIVAIATPLQRSAIACIRLSGEEALNIFSTIVYPSNLKFSPWIMKHCTIIEPKSRKKIDDVIAVYMKAPKSYTGEDMVEIYCHGGVAIIKSIFETLVMSGARPATPGEFTKRAFLNGKMDLIQAEAIDQITKAETENELVSLNENLFGALSGKIRDILSKFIDLKARLEAQISYEDDLLHEDLDIEESLQILMNEIDETINNSQDINQLIQGFRVTIIGKTNVGKSSIFNAILGWDRMLISEYPSTTHDYVEETIELYNYKIKLVDTAGSAENPTELDRLFAEKIEDLLNKTDLILLIIDMSDYSNIDDLIVKKYINRNIIIVINKSDKNSKIPEKLLELIPENKKYIIVSALKKEGIEELKKLVAEEAQKGINWNADYFVNERQRGLLLKARENLLNIINIKNKEKYLDIVCFELDQIIATLGEELGLNISKEVFDNIFTNFCIGK